MLAAYFGMARAADRGATAGWWRSSSAMRSSGSSGSPPRTRTTQSVPFGRACGSCEDAEELEPVGGAPLASGSGSTRGRRSCAWVSRAGSGERVPVGRRDQHRLTDPVGRAGDGRGGRPRHLRGDRSGLRLRRAGARDPEGEVRAGAGLPRQERRGPASAPISPAPTTRPFIGREIDLALLKGIFDKTRRRELGAARHGRRRAGPRQVAASSPSSSPTSIRARAHRPGGRDAACPYGEGITFWALGEILKAHAGILESDPPDVAQAKLETVLPEGDEREWFRQRLLPLLGIEATSTAEREELFTAWRRFLEHIAEQHPTVLVFEDLHWADDGDARVPRAPRGPSPKASRSSWSAPPGRSCSKRTLTSRPTAQRHPDQPGPAL